MAIKKNIIEQLRKYKTVLIKHGIEIEQFYLFGSYAINNQKKDSDIDVAIISKSFTGNRFYDSLTVAKLRKAINLQIEPITFRPEDFNDNDPLANQIILYGKKI